MKRVLFSDVVLAEPWLGRQLNGKSLAETLALNAVQELASRGAVLPPEARVAVKLNGRFLIVEITVEEKEVLSTQRALSSISVT